MSRTAGPDAGQPLPPYAASVATTLRAIAILAALALTIWLLSSIVLLIFMAVLFTAMLSGASDWAARRTGASRQAMLALVALGSAALLLGLTYYIGPRLMEQSQALWTQLHQQVDHLRESYGDTPLGRTIVEDLSPPQAVQDHFVSYAGTLATPTLGGLTTAFILIVTSLYFAISPLAATRIRCTGCLGFRNILREDDNDAGTAPVGSHHYAHRLAGFDDDISHRADPSMGDGLAHATCW